MIVVTSRFRVVNGMENDVREAFINRPGLVNSAPGFLGMEVFTDADDPAIFHLVTRWTDTESYDSWHDGGGKKSTIPFLPKGLKLDPEYTRLERIQRIEAPGRPPADSQVRDMAPFLAQALNDSAVLYHLSATPEGTLCAVNRAFERSLQVSRENLLGTSLWDYLTEPDAAWLRSLLDGEEPPPTERRVLNFVDKEDHPFSLWCLLDTSPMGITILAEEPVQANRQSQSELLHLTNELSVLHRENQRKTRDLEEARQKLEDTLEELNTSFWHLRKIQEFLPVCAYCKKVRIGDGNAEWTDLLDHLSQHSDIFSHGLCPECLKKQLALIDEESESA